MDLAFKRYGPVRGKAPGVAAIDYDGDRYCLDCAPDVLDGQTLNYQTGGGEWETTEDADGEAVVDRLVRGDIYTLGNGGVVLKHGVNNGEQWHCGRHKGCENALGPDEHDYGHDVDVGVRLKV